MSKKKTLLRLKRNVRKILSLWKSYSEEKLQSFRIWRIIMDFNLGNLNFGNLFEHVQKMQENMKTVKEELDAKTVEGTSGGDMVKALVSGSREVKELTIDPKIVDTSDIEMLQDLVIAAVNDGLRKAEEMVQQEMSKLTGGLSIPGFDINQFM
jgi:DNA-binding YbaB/EbfC family protein